MEKKLFIANNGQQVIASDVDTLGETAALADDRVFAELFRLTPYNGSTVARGIVPYGEPSTGYTAQVAPNGASGSVLVYPFRAIVGTRTAVASDAKANLRDIRSAIAVGSTTLAQTVSLGANASGNPRWDLIYAGVSLDANDTSVTRKIKDPTTKVIAGASVTITKSNTVALAVQAGTPAASPTLPTIPPDAGSTYYIPIAYVRVPNGFGAGSTVTVQEIAMAAPIVGVAAVAGGAPCRVANSHNKVGLSIITSAKMQAWGADPAVNYPRWIGPSAGLGVESLMFTVGLTTGSETHTNGQIIDDTRDWRRRVSRFFVAASTIDSVPFNLTGTPYHYIGSAGGELVVGMGHSFTVDSNRRVLDVAGNAFTAMTDGTNFGLDVDSSGRLILNYTGAPNCKFFVWIDFSGPFPLEAP